jgi:hypothetical protein
MLTTVLFWLGQCACLSVLLVSSVLCVSRSMGQIRIDESSKSRRCEILAQLPFRAGVLAFLLSMVTTLYVIDVNLFGLSLQLLPTGIHHAVFFMYPGVAILILGMVMTTICEWVR